MIGRILGNRYELTRELGSGGMAWVYLAEDLAPGDGSRTHHDKRVAVKILYPQLANDAAFLHRFMQEARLLVSLGEDAVAKVAGAAKAAGANGDGQESAIVPVLDYGADRDTHYLVMEYVPGRDLREVLEEEGPLEWRRALGITRQVAAALDRANSHGVVHRDVKPGNIMLVPGDRVRVLDFGVARARTSPTLTHSGFVGSPYYVAPEQAMGHRVDIRADLYSLGVVLYEMVTGRTPFESDTPWIVVNHHIATPPPSPADARPELPVPVARLVVHALAKRPEDRFQTPAELMRAIDVVLAGGDPSTAWGAVTPALNVTALQPGGRPPAPFLDALYAQGQQAGARGAWAEAVDVFSQVLKFDARYRDVAERLADAGRQARLGALYRAAVEALETGQRDEARLLLDEIACVAPDYKDVVALRKALAAAAGTTAGSDGEGVQRRAPARRRPARRTGWAGHGKGAIAAALLLVCAAFAAWALGGAFFAWPRSQPAAAALAASPAIGLTSCPDAQPSSRTQALSPPSHTTVAPAAQNTQPPAAPTSAACTGTPRPSWVEHEGTWLPLLPPGEGHSNGSDGRHLPPAAGTADAQSTAAGNSTAAEPVPALPPGATVAPGVPAGDGWIAFARFDEARQTYDVHACRPDGSGCHLLIACASQPAYLPGGRALAVHSWQPEGKGLLVVAVPEAAANAAGSVRVLWRITDQIEAARPAVDARGRAVYHARVEVDREPRLWIAGGGSAVPLLSGASGVVGRAPAWTPGGEIVYAGCAGDACGILIVGARGDSPRQVVAGGSETAPEVSPDGADVAFMSHRDGNWEVYIAPLAGIAPPRRVTTHPGNDGLPAWSPDGRWLAFVSDRGGAWAVWVVRVEGGQPSTRPVRLFFTGGPLDGSVEGAAAHEVHGWVEERISWSE